jgi:hypothetical protein
MLSLKSLDKFHLFDIITQIPLSLIFEILIIIFTINVIFSIIYYNIYKKNNNSFRNIHNNKLNYIDFLYFSSTSFFSLGYDIIPKISIIKILIMIQLKLSFIISTIYLSKIIQLIL